MRNKKIISLVPRSEILRKSEINRANILRQLSDKSDKSVSLIILTWVRRIYQTQKKRFFPGFFQKIISRFGFPFGRRAKPSEGACDWNLLEIFLLIFYCWFYLDFCVDFKIQSENHEKIYSKILWGIKKSFRSFLAQKSWENLKLKSGWKSE